MGKRSIVHVEIPMADQDASKKFYNALCDWEIQDVPTPDGSTYTTFGTGNIGAALAPVSGQMKPSEVLIYIGSDDIEADLKKAESLGGKVSQSKMDIPGFGALGVFVDPAGNKVAFWQEKNGG